MNEDKTNSSAPSWTEGDPITDEQLSTIAKIILNWGQAESILGKALDFVYDVRHSDAGDLPHVLSIRKKVDYLKKKTKLNPPCDDFLCLLSEMFYCLKKFKYQRDIIAHGVIAHGGDGKASFLSFKDLSEIPMSELDSILERSRYACNIALHIFRSLAGLTREPLPKRPA
jgi:hypothetical protein